MTEQLTVTVGPTDGRSTVLAVGGELDRDSAHVLETAGLTAVESGVKLVVLDLGAVSFCDSSGLRTFVHLHHQAKGRGVSLRLAELRSPLSEIVEVVNLDRLLALHPTVDDALR